MLALVANSVVYGNIRDMFFQQTLGLVVRHGRREGGNFLYLIGNKIGSADEDGQQNNNIVIKTNNNKIRETYLNILMKYLSYQIIKSVSSILCSTSFVYSKFHSQRKHEFLKQSHLLNVITANQMNTLSARSPNTVRNTTYTPLTSNTMSSNRRGGGQWNRCTSHQRRYYVHLYLYKHMIYLVDNMRYISLSLGVWFGMSLKFFINHFVLLCYSICDFRQYDLILKNRSLYLLTERQKMHQSMNGVDTNCTHQKQSNTDDTSISFLLSTNVVRTGLCLQQLTRRSTLYEAQRSINSRLKRANILAWVNVKHKFQ